MRKKVLCPICQGRLFDADEAMELKLYPVKPEAELSQALYLKCSKCGKICAVTFKGQRQPVDLPNQESSCGTIIPITATLQDTQTSVEIKLNIVYSVQS